AVALSVALDAAAATELSAWSARPSPDENEDADGADAAPAELGLVELALSGRRGVDRSDEFERWQQRQRLAGRVYSVNDFALKAGISRTQIYEFWFTYVWPDSCFEGECILQTL